MRVDRKVSHGVDLGKGNVGVRQPLQQIVARHRRKAVADGLVGEFAIADALDHVGEPWIVRQGRKAQNVRAQFFPFAFALNRNQDVLAILGAEHAVGRDRGVGETHPLRRIAGLRIEQRHR
jgi:hypothetical protein